MSLVLVVSLHVIHEEFLAQVFWLRCPAGSGPAGLWVSGNSHVACSIQVSHVVLLLKSGGCPQSMEKAGEVFKKGSNADFILVTVTSALFRTACMSLLPAFLVLHAQLSPRRAALCRS